VDTRLGLVAGCAAIANSDTRVASRPGVLVPVTPPGGAAAPELPRDLWTPRAGSSRPCSVRSARTCPVSGVNFGSPCTFVPLLTCCLLLSLPRAQAAPGDFVACFGGPEATPAPPSCSFADYDKDGDVDLFDFSMFSEYCAGATGNACINDTLCYDNDNTTLDECVKCGGESYCNNEVIPGYQEWLAANPKFMNATFTSGWFEPDVINQTWKDIRLLERIGRVNVPLPQEFLDCQEPESCLGIPVYDLEVRPILAARAANAAWLDKNEITVWRLEDFQQDWIFGMITRGFIYDPFFHDYGGGFQYVVDHSPSEVFEYAKKHMRSTLTETIE